MLLQKFQQFMMGRYGGDKFNLFLLILALVFSLASRAFWPLMVLAYALLAYGLFRMLSKNRAARQRELFAFLKVWGPVENWFKFQATRWKQRKIYKYFRCPRCKQRLRAPRGRGKIQVTCQKCGNVFVTKA